MAFSRPTIWLAGLALALGACTAPAQGGGDDHPVDPTGAKRVIVELRVDSQACAEPRDAEACEQAIAEVRELVLGELVGTKHEVGRVFGSIPFLALNVDRDALRALQASKHVAGIRDDSLAAPQSP